MCNVIEYDLSKYKELVEGLGEASIDVEAALDDFPVDTDQHWNDRYNAARRTRDVENEGRAIASHWGPPEPISGAPGQVDGSGVR